ncbi:MAG: nucleoside phosphorylase [Clostridiales Family XIII bacterium]|nr:nucleoside phosphorylase [Clostridiales Family XIII bacterium]
MARNVNKASAPTDGAGKVYHLRLGKGDVPQYMILPGAPERTTVIAQGWEDVKEVASYREYKTVTGRYKNVPIGTTSTGIGAASSEIAIHELSTLGVHTCIRVGTTGVIQPEFDLGDLVISSACVRHDGTSDNYIEPAYPAAADTVVTMALMQACENLGYRYGVGIGCTTASFYIGQARPLTEGRGMIQKMGGVYEPSFMADIIPDLRSAGVINIEMEAAGQFVVGRLHGIRMGAVLAAVSNRVTNKWGEKGGEEKAAKTASEAVYILKEWEVSGEISLKLSKRLRVDGIYY